MTLIVGNVVDVGLRGLDGALRVWAWFRPEEVGLIAPYRREWEIRQGEIESGVDVVPGPAVVEVDCGPDAYTSVEVTVPDAESVSLKDLFEQVYAYTPAVVSEAYAERLRAEVAAVAAEESAGVALGAERGALTAEQRAALSAATLSARVEQPGQDILYTSDGKPYFADPAQIENVPLRVDRSVGTRVMLGNQMIYGDTGVRRLGATESLNGAALNVARVYRQGNLVHLYLDVAVTDWVSGDSFMVIPIGFRPSWGHLLPQGYQTTAPDVTTTGSELKMHYNGTNVGFRFMYTWHTADGWPVSLPGVPG